MTVVEVWSAICKVCEMKTLQRADTGGPPTECASCGAALEDITTQTVRVEQVAFRGEQVE